MTIKYADGRAVEGILLSRMEETMRVAVQDGDDAVEFRCIDGMWISENFEPVEIQFEWQRAKTQQPGFETDRCCTEALASRLIDVLFRGDEVETYWSSSLNPQEDWHLIWTESVLCSTATRLPN
jgi:hypothetical protein